jgi:ABC-type lipoprotein release transport system permease subunit
VIPSVIHGRAPVAADEILLGPDTARIVGVEIGDRVDAFGQTGEYGEEATFVDTKVPMHVVGTGVIPLAGGEQRLGRGAVVTLDGLRALNPVADVEIVWLRFAPGANGQAVVAALARALHVPDAGPGQVFGFGSADAGQLLDLRQVDSTPRLLGVLMGVMVLAVLAHVLVTSVRAHRRELAILKTLGLSRAQVVRTVAWQATTLSAVGLVVGLPLGVVAGRAAWLFFADRLGVVPEAVVTPGLLLLIPGLFVLAVVVAAAPGWVAARTRPAEALRSP